MQRSAIGLIVALALLVVPLIAEAQQRVQVPRIGVLSMLTGSTADVAKNIEAFRQGLRDLGYVEGQNIVIEYRYADGKYDRFPDLVADLVRLNMGVIIAA